MAKRYGRNQRRKHREEIALLANHLRVAVDRKIAVEKRANVLEQRIVCWADRIRRVCGEDHPFNEEMRRRIVASLPQYFRVSPPMTLSLDRLVWSNPVEVSVTYMELAAVHVESRQAPPKDIGQAIIELATPEGRSAIYLDRRFIREGRRDPKFEIHVARRLNEELDRIGEAA